MESTMAGKWVELLKKVAPRVARAAILLRLCRILAEPFKAAAASFAAEANVAPVHDTSLESVVAAQAHAPNGSLIVMPDTFMTTRQNSAGPRW
jgi:putative ABC transport system substrate-binding protein